MPDVMDQVALVAHLPGLRLRDPAVSFLGGQAELQRLPWELYHNLTGGAHDRKSEYVADEPVILMSQRMAPLAPPSRNEGRSFAEAKTRSDKYDVIATLPNRDVVIWGIDLAYTAWACLSLAFPLSGFIQPRQSTMFLVPQGTHEFPWGDHTASGIQLQGEADHEYLFANSLAGPMLSREDVVAADKLLALVGPIGATPALGGAMESLLASQDPALGRMEQGLLCVIALEELLLAGQTRNLRRDFAERLAALVPGDQQATVPEKTFRHLYDLRSDFLHGRREDEAEDANLLAYAPMLLSAAIRSLGQAVRDGEQLPDILAAGPDELARVAAPDGWQTPDEFRPENRISGHRHSLVASMTTTMNLPEGTAAVWSPYLGLAAPSEGMAIGETDQSMFLPIRYRELADLEDRNIRGDFMQQMTFAIEAGKIPDTGRACLLMPLADGTPGDLGLRAPRDYAPVRAFTIALRVLGFGRFSDPYLLGEYTYYGGMRLRLPTVYRQTLVFKYFKEFDEPDAAALARAAELRDLVLRVSHAYPVLDRLLTLLREAHYHEVLSDAVQARLCFAFIDGAVGRLTGDDIGAQVTRLGQAVAPGDIGHWFAQDARQMRNALAHAGSTSVQEDDLAALMGFARAMGLKLLEYVEAAGPDETISTKGFQAALKAGIAA